MINAAKAWYTKISKRLPAGIRGRLEASPLNPVALMKRWELRQAERSGPPYRPTHRKIIIDITASCNLGCMDCNRSCGEGQAPSSEHMSAAQIEKFVEESVRQGRKWDEIAIEGGEPTLHPGLEVIAGRLLEYRRTFSPRTSIRIQTNGYGSRTARVDALRREGICIIDTRKTSKAQPHHCAFNLAPCDEPVSSGTNFSRGCILPACYGLGLTMHGYYPHPVCGGIDRVFGFDIGRKSLPAAGDLMNEQFERLCPLCGFFSRRRGSGMSISWKNAYARYQDNPPALTRY